MATRDEIVEAINGAMQRLDKLTPQIMARLEQPLPEGTWTVHDAVCHLAADGNAVPRFLARVERMQAGQPARPAGFNMDQHNEDEIAKRKGLPLADVLREARDGFEADIARVRDLDSGLLESEVPNFRGELTPASDQIRFTAAGHPNIHLDDIEKALGA